MNRKLFHGSADIVSSPAFGKGRPNNDYGSGFYCTENIDLAREWAVLRDRDGYANCYEIDDEDLNILDLSDTDYCVLHWLSVLLQNRTFSLTAPLAEEAREYIVRNFSVDISKYDVITGYRADDSYFSFAQDFLNGTISYRQLSNAMHLGKPGMQYVLKSSRAFERIVFTGFEKVLSEVWYEKKMIRDTTARNEYLNAERYRRQRGDLFIVQILDEEIKPDDSRLR